MELWLDNGKLVSKDKWEKTIDTLRDETKESSKENIREAFVDAIRKRLPADRFGIFLSGGVDSSLIALTAKKLGGDFTCYTVGVKESDPDVTYARKVAKDLGIELKVKIYSLEEIENIIKKLVKKLPNTDPVSVGIGSVICAAVELAKKDGVDTFLGGLGAEEIFAGYQRHIDTAVSGKDINEECWRGLKSMWSTDLARDFALAQLLSIKVLTPFLDEKLIRAAMGISGDRKIANGERKVILREIAEEMGLPKYSAWRKKQAAQYGSGFDKAIEKLAKMKKMTKSNYLTSLK